MTPGINAQRFHSPRRRIVPLHLMTDVMATTTEKRGNGKVQKLHFLVSVKPKCT